MRFFLAIMLLTLSWACGEEVLYLKNNLALSKPGDYLVLNSNKTNTLMHIYDKKDGLLTIEEVVVPENKKKFSSSGWKEWIQKNAPGNTSWVLYEINTTTGQMVRYYSFTKNGWFEIPEADNFISKLLNLKFLKIPESERKKIGLKPIPGQTTRPLWHPPMIVDGKKIPKVFFDAWKTTWPKDNSELSGRTIEVFTPQDQKQFLSYFPYWLQVSGVVGKANIRIVDSGKNLKSPKPELDSVINNASHNGLKMND